MKGTLIVLDGTDGSGKGTQHMLLAKRLQTEGYAVETIDFPQYGSKSAGPIEEYLNGRYGEFEDISPYVASLFYTIDRFAAKKKLLVWLNEGKVVLANRYVSSNMGHQGAHFATLEERKKFWEWLSAMEYDVFGIPRPDWTFILSMPVEISQALILEKSQREYLGDKKQDIHEKNTAHLSAARSAYCDLTTVYDAIELVECAPDGILLSKQEIHDTLYKKVLPHITKNVL
ncbi:MAG: hypothetical protein A3H59_01555 [Candidatus Jacksonbacteria bacterium RIFCSPLOWO2_02_FULL_43_9]|nr:MAG: Thymidylate kinase [Parcubacteria group bacterium GW2011_GWA2_43_13]OGY68974.1 MAG: hypothetical protein A3B94_02225 [Candidatus Jacksonbacteria bacterium RIFCSPHIGHO2_02_FULL_43_10]OGY70361.1 MAG: hypothetical protein A2986_00190 [Candidatus Jacksonbacteria bacterium RIFCSPLOWO2_01_FULL_44_13]OGY72699.1 MAG: hypothetical protein A3H59_01555 [Candidatus Jacksonbacteria bacterium RIFCSPLOWO2_02_FULL_43_9]HAZ16553.1 thymidylate kinase [Candidatus Jacksonbacteria bacterium]